MGTLIRLDRINEQSRSLRLLTQRVRGVIMRVMRKEIEYLNGDIEDLTMNEAQCDTTWLGVVLTSAFFGFIISVMSII